jgi:hypothetical protein
MEAECGKEILRYYQQNSSGKINNLLHWNKECKCLEGIKKVK